MHTHAQWKCSEYFNVCASVLVCELQGAKLRVQQLSIPMWPLLTLHRSAGVPLHRVNYLWVFSTVIMGGCPLSNHFVGSLSFDSLNITYVNFYLYICTYMSNMSIFYMISQ